LAQTEATAKEAKLAADEKEGCIRNLKIIYQAIQNYRADHKDIPNWLSDLVPQYINDANFLTCPACKRTGEIESGALADPKIPCSYLYEFCPLQLGKIDAPSHPAKTRREWKQRQMGLVGSIVPIVRCRHHAVVLNLAFDGRIYESPPSWEVLLTNLLDVAELQPARIFAADSNANAGEKSAPPAPTYPPLAASNATPAPPPLAAPKATPPNPQPGDASAPQPAISDTGSQLTTLKSQLPSTSSSFAGNMDTLDDKRKLAVGDRITFRVIEEQEDPKALTVTDSGELDIPDLGLVTAVGKTCKELAFQIKSNLLQTTYYRATVIIGIDLLNKTMSGRRVYLAGEIRRPGPQEIPAGQAWTVSKAILSAGGFTEYANKKEVRLVRSASGSAPGKTITLSIADIWEKGRTELDLPVEPEDLIYVPGRAVNF
jgi:protein involved in polysaccharide export with SLBB domain